MNFREVPVNTPTGSSNLTTLSHSWTVLGKCHLTAKTEHRHAVSLTLHGQTQRVVAWRRRTAISLKEGKALIDCDIFSNKLVCVVISTVNSQSQRLWHINKTTKTLGKWAKYSWPKVSLYIKGIRVCS